ncbi:MAG: GAF domain-containing protein [Chloroflexaceae bacterium]|nr:GAF domain-containing protein [Chloroflexaceae bacterium]
MTQSKSLTTVSAMLLGQAKRLTGSVSGFISYVDPNTGYLIYPTPQNRMDEGLVWVKTCQHLWPWFRKYHQSFLSNQPATDPRLLWNVHDTFLLQRLLLVPVLSEGVLIGQLAVANARHPYTDHDRQILERLARMYALSIKRSKVLDTQRQEDERMSLLLHHMPGMIYRYRSDTARSLEFVSQGCLELTGYPPAYFVLHGRAAYESLIHPDDRKRVTQQFALACHAKRPGNSSTESAPPMEAKNTYMNRVARLRIPAIHTSCLKGRSWISPNSSTA